MPHLLPPALQILSGDPKQLGPTIRSSVAHDLGLGMSLQEFLMRTGGPRMYQPSTMYEGDIRCITALRRNYRCGPGLPSPAPRACTFGDGGVSSLYICAIAMF